MVHISISVPRIRMKSFIFGKQQGLACEFEKFLFSIGAPGIEDGGDFPMVVRVRSDETSIHGTVGVLAEGEAFGGRFR